MRKFLIVSALLFIVGCGTFTPDPQTGLTPIDTGLETAIKTFAESTAKTGYSIESVIMAAIAAATAGGLATYKAVHKKPVTPGA